MSDAYIIHVNYDEILDEIAKLQLHDKNLTDKLTSYIDSLRKITLKLEPVYEENLMRMNASFGMNIHNYRMKDY